MQNHSLYKTLLKLTSDDYYYDLYENNIHEIKGTLDNTHYIKSTLNEYKRYHQQYDVIRFKELLNVLESISLSDTVVSIGETRTPILKEFYKILSLIHKTDILLKHYHDSFDNKKFSYIQSDLRQIDRESKRAKKLIIQAKSPLVNKTEIRFKWKIFHIYRKNPKMAKFIINSFLLSDIQKIGMLYNEDKQNVEIILENLAYFLTQKATIKDIIKSLGILLYHQIKIHLQVKSTQAERHTSEIIAYLYNETVNTDEFNCSIYIRSSVKGIPVFGARRKPYFVENEKKFVRNNLIKEIRLKNTKDKINYILLDESINHYIDNPHITYLQKYPLEFFRKNSKYSHLPDLF